MEEIAVDLMSIQSIALNANVSLEMGWKKLAEIIDLKKWHAKLEIYEAWSTLFETN